MELIVNGELRQFSEQGVTMTVRDLLIALHYLGKRVAVEHNGEIVPRSAHEQHLLHAGDRLEIVVAVGGG
ncbi:MAG: sulfur carrier protein ThiS [Pseudomonadota bacterium]